MNIRYIKIGNIFLNILHIMSALIILFQMFGFVQITSAVFTLSFFLVFTLWVMHFTMQPTKLDIIAIIILVLSFISIMISAVVENGDISFYYLKKWIMFCCTILHFSTVVKINLTQAQKNLILYLNMALTVIMLLTYIFGQDVYQITNIGKRYLTLGFSNPNILALFLTLLFIINVIAIINFINNKKRFLFISLIIVNVCVFLMILITKSRNTIITVVLFIILMLICIKKNTLLAKLNNAIYIIIAVFPLLFAIIYMFLIDFIMKNDFFSFLVEEGKDLDSRVIIWSFAVDIIKESPIIGNFSRIIYSFEHSQMHNTHLDILASYGLIVFLLVIGFIFIVLIKMKNNTNALIKSVALLGFVCGLILGMGEAILFSGGLSFYILMGELILLNNNTLDNHALDISNINHS